MPLGALFQLLFFPDSSTVVASSHCNCRRALTYHRMGSSRLVVIIGKDGRREPALAFRRRRWWGVSNSSSLGSFQIGNRPSSFIVVRDYSAILRRRPFAVPMDANCKPFASLRSFHWIVSGAGGGAGYAASSMGELWWSSGFILQHSFEWATKRSSGELQCDN